MHEEFTNMRSMLGALAEAMNLIDRSVENHHEMTAYLAYMVALEAGLEGEQLLQTLYAALTHDIGSIVNDEVGTVEEIERNADKYAVIGAKLVSGFPGSEAIGQIIRFCQCPWTDFLAAPEAQQPGYCERARIASLIHVADVVATVVRQDVPILNQVAQIRELVQCMRGTEFSPEAADAFLRVSEREFIWMDLRYNPQFLSYFTGDIHPISLDRAVELTGFMSRIIDYRSAFTAMHSAGVSASAETLGKLLGMDEAECKMMRIAGHLHDIGKLRVPRAILEKPGKLTDAEFNIVKEHPYYTRLILMNVDGFEKIADWAALHHEKLNGKGYPFHFSAPQLDLGSRIMAVADIFSAITEERPYRPGMSKLEALKVLETNVTSGAIDGDIVATLRKNYELVDGNRQEASRREGTRYYASMKE